MPVKDPQPGYSNLPVIDAAVPTVTTRNSGSDLSRVAAREYEETDADLAAGDAWRARHDVEGEWHG
jgi:hypothetical protein